MPDIVNEPLVGLGKSGSDPIIEKLDMLIEGQDRMNELLEEITEKLTDLELTTNPGFGYEN